MLTRGPQAAPAEAPELATVLGLFQAQPKTFDLTAFDSIGEAFSAIDAGVDSGGDGGDGGGDGGGN